MPRRQMLIRRRKRRLSDHVSHKHRYVSRNDRKCRHAGREASIAETRRRRGRKCRRRGRSSNDFRNCSDTEELLPKASKEREKERERRTRDSNYLETRPRVDDTRRKANLPRKMNEDGCLENSTVDLSSSSSPSLYLLQSRRIDRRLSYIYKITLYILTLF